MILFSFRALTSNPLQFTCTKTLTWSSSRLVRSPVQRFYNSPSQGRWTDFCVRVLRSAFLYSYNSHPQEHWTDFGVLRLQISSLTLLQTIFTRTLNSLPTFTYLYNLYSPEHWTNSVLVFLRLQFDVYTIYIHENFELSVSVWIFIQLMSPTPLYWFRAYFSRSPLLHLHSL